MQIIARRTVCSLSCLLFLPVFFCHGENDAQAEEMFRRARFEYKEARYMNAIAFYDSLLRMGVQDIRLYYNLGNVFFKTGRIAKSKLYYEKAFMLDPTDEDVAHNLNVVNARLRDRVEPVPQLFIVQWWNDFTQTHSVSSLFTLSVVFFFLLCAVCVVYYWWQLLWLRRIAFFCGILLLLCFVVSVFFMLDKQEDFSARRMSIIMDNSVIAKSTPDKSGSDSFTVHEGLKVEVIDTLDTWVKIRLADGKQGWLHAQSIERI